MRLYADSAKCSGCRACLVACSLNLFQESNPKKASLNLIAHFPSPGVYEMKVCTQCGDCAAVRCGAQHSLEESAAWQKVSSFPATCPFSCLLHLPSRVSYVPSCVPLHVMHLHHVLLHLLSLGDHFLYDGCHGFHFLITLCCIHGGYFCVKPGIHFLHP